MTGRELKLIIASSVLAVVGLGLWVWSWYLPLYEQKINEKIALLAPAFCIMGIGNLLMPIDVESPFFKAFEKGELEHVPTYYKIMLSAATISSIINWIAIRFVFL